LPAPRSRIAPAPAQCDRSRGRERPLAPPDTPSPKRFARHGTHRPHGEPQCHGPHPSLVCDVEISPSRPPRSSTQPPSDVVALKPGHGNEGEPSSCCLPLLPSFTGRTKSVTPSASP